MKRTTIFLPENLHDELRSEAFRCRVSMATLIRTRLEITPKKRSKPRIDPLVKAAGACTGPILSKSIDEELYGI